VSGYTSAYVTCDGRIPRPDTASGYRLCRARVEGGEYDGALIYPSTLAAARRLARKLGWTYVPYPHVPALADDYCPDHADQAQAKAEQRGVKITRPKPKTEG
jgi:hypothetical protein